MRYMSTRDVALRISPSQGILQGISQEGGLLVPEQLPHVELDLDRLKDMDYRELALHIMHPFFTDFDREELRDRIHRAYDDKFSHPEIAPLVKVGDQYFLELFHGPTLAFKDMALSILPHLLVGALKHLDMDKQVLILTATSGDTGKAALEGFSNVEKIRIMVFYPQDGVSEIQKRQMITHGSDNSMVVGIHGNFDDAQNGVKELFNNADLRHRLTERNILLSSANSINIGRLVPQIVYYFYGYAQLLKNNEIAKGESINVVVPTGNFGNILAAYYAKGMGLPIHRLICASNENNVLTDFFHTGNYSIKRPFRMTSSPSMDILISSNLERLLFEISGRDDHLIKKLIRQLQSRGEYSIEGEMLERLEDFYAGFAKEEDVFKEISQLFQRENYLMDPHTAVAYRVYQDYRNSTQDPTKTVIASTASPFKFGRSVCHALGLEQPEDDFALLEVLSKATGLDIPQGIKDLEHRSILHPYTCHKDEMEKMLEDFIREEEGHD